MTTAAATVITLSLALSKTPPLLCSYNFEGPFDIDRLAYAVAVKESSNCTAGKSLRTGNCHSIGEQVYASKAESYAAFKALWRRSYGNDFPNRITAHKYNVGPKRMPQDGYSWHPGACDWIQHISRIYNK